MTATFFGRFLVESGEIDEGQLRAALEAAQDINLPLGALAVRRGWLDARQAEAIHRAQQRRDLPFGELAVRLGHLDRSQVCELLRLQSETHLYIGEALVRSGALGPERLATALAAYKALEADFPQPPEAPPEFRGHALLEAVLAKLPRLALRLAGLQLKCDPARAFDGASPHPCTARLRVEGSAPASFGLAASRELAGTWAAGILGAAAGPTSAALAADALCEFLNLLVGTAKNDVTEVHPDQRLVLATPEAGALPRGTAFDLVTTAGPGTLAIQLG